MEQDEEKWEPIDGFENAYQISSFGRVRSLNRTVTHSNGRQFTISTRILTLHKTENQIRVYLRNKSIRKSHSVQLLVATKFVANPKPDEFNHVIWIDGNKENNHHSNLKWVKKVNHLHEYWLKHGAPAKGHIKAQKTVEQVCIKTGSVIATWKGYKSILIGLGLRSSHISECCHNKLFSAHGYIWRFVEE